MAIIDYLNRFPSVPPIPRGTPRSHVNFMVSDAEYRLMQAVLIDPNTQALYNREMSRFWRHLLMIFSNELQQAIAAPEHTDIIESIERFLLNHNLHYVNEAGVEKVKDIGKTLMLYKEANLLEDGLKLYGEMLDFVDSRPHPWDKVLGRKVNQDMGIQGFRDWARETDWAALREVEDTHGDSWENWV